MNDITPATHTVNAIIQKLLLDAIKEVAPSENMLTVDVVHPGDESMGDYATSVALSLAKKLKMKPIDLANKIVQTSSFSAASLKKTGIEKVEVKSPGFINFWLSDDYFVSRLREVLKNPTKFFINTVDLGELDKSLKKQSNNIKLPQKTGKLRFLFEFAHPNTHKEFHIGHLRNISIAESLIRIFEACGIEIVRSNYQGDVGMHIAKCLFGILQISNLKSQISKLKTLEEKVALLGKAYVEGNRAYEENESAKKEIIAINRKIYEKDSGIYKLWKETRQWSLDYFETIYKRVGSHYDRYYFESEVFESGRQVVLEYLQKGVFEKDQGAVIFPGKKYGLHNRVFITNESFPTYEAKEMGLGVLQFKEYDPDLIIHVVGPEQAGYFQVVFKALEQVLPESVGRELHYVYGWVQLKAGKMSSRKGNVVTARWLLGEAREKALKVMRQAQAKNGGEIDSGTAEKIGLAAVKYSFLKFSAKSNISFDFEESVSLDGDSGPYLLYTYARTRSVLAKIKSQISNLKNIDSKTKILNSEEMAVAKSIARFTEVIREAGLQMAPNILCTYLYDLASKYNLFYTKHSILTPKEGAERVQFRLALTRAMSQVLNKGLELLGIETVERM